MPFNKQGTQPERTKQRRSPVSLPMPLGDDISKGKLNQPDNSYGFVYIFINQSMPGLLKIGQTERHPAIRAAELSNHTGVPTPYQLEFFTEVSDRFAAERCVHKALSDHRVKTDREFFKVSLESARKTVCDEVRAFLPLKSPFRPYLDSLIQEDPRPKGVVCSKCGAVMKTDAFGHWKCFAYGHTR